MFKGDRDMEQNVFAINRQIKARALDALTGNFFSILKLLFLPMILAFVLVMFGNEFLSIVAGIVASVAMLAFFPHVSTLMALQQRSVQEARNYAKSWSWFALFTVWSNRAKMGVDYLVYTILMNVLVAGSLFGFLIPAILVGTLFDGFVFLGIVFGAILLIVWMVLATWVSFKLGLADYVFADAIFGSATATAFNDVDFSSMSMMQRLTTVVRTSWTLMTWRVFWRWVWFGLTFTGWVIFSIVTLGLALFFVMPYMMMASVAFYEQVIAEKYGKMTVSEEEVVTISRGVKVEVLQPKSK